MIIWLNPFTEDEFFSYVNDFDIDDEIEIHRQDQRYRSAFTISKSLSDFRSYHKNLKKIANKLKRSQK